MPKKIPSTAKQRRSFMLHVVAFLIINAIMWYFTYAGKENEPFVYPWPIWITATWFLLVVGHACMIWYNYEDPNFDEYRRQALEG